MKKIAVILMNLGGPSNQASVRPFLFSLFYDKNIIRLALPWRWLLAKMISIFRAPKAKKLYAKMGGGSPILVETELQRQALGKQLMMVHNKFESEVFIAMRHSEPSSASVIDQLAIYKPDEVILLPLYPQFSTTTTKSAFEDFLAKYQNKTIVKSLCCYPFQANFIDSHVKIINEALKDIKNLENYKILFSAHSLPVSIIEAGDPYQWQIEQSVKAIVRKLNHKDHKITYQSRISPVKWLKPDTGEIVEQLAKENKSIIIVPIAFVSEHVETLVELDIDYKNIAQNYAIDYIRLPTLRVEANFIEALSQMIENLVDEPLKGIYSDQKKRLCPINFPQCPCNF